jgi:hypothetical protein
MHRFIEGQWLLVRLPVTWFYVSWILGLLLLSLPLFKYTEAFSGGSAAYVLGILVAFSVGTVAAAFWGRRPRARNAEVPKALAVSNERAASTKLVGLLMAAGIIGTGLVLLNALLGGTLSIADRFDADNFSAIRAEHMTLGRSSIGPLFGPANLMSAVGGLGVAYVMYLRGARALGTGLRRWMFPMALAVLGCNLFVGFVGFGSRMFAVFALLVAFIAFVEGRWSIGERIIAKRLTFRGFFVITVSSAVVLSALWVAATVFLENRVQRQDPQLLLFRTHRATLTPESYGLVRNDTTSQYFMLSLSYLTVPIPTLTYYLDLPAARQPGPFFGEYNFPPFFRWGRRITFTGDPWAWERARYDIFKPLGDIGFGMNVWSTMVRDLIADFGRWGALFFLALLGFLSQRLFDRQREEPSPRRAGLLVYLRLLLSFSGLVSMLFMAQIHWPLYLAVFLLLIDGQRSRARRFVPQGSPKLGGVLR